ncbi:MULTISPECIES: hypothetical protein [Caldilinea]|jgi:hypothetical protein|uniref:Uncharacterized protein n=1 Tax=Caldilinea aerophila (strain DSM 14535 / JCM 11387 / NBRC 104270 / STL-6-O1) TaxID=926550 RepID=I0I7G9_CALAS|nr:MULTISPECIES: hypothetical protein [Caldilinea]MBO9391909.1 hypothetical protein [Caldilinea sp.]BAM01207.1 hypothetical protein CLDAP_31670 [Caldilinea aerophila DSM 14535 = NBRC 104270]GIV72549.1 MAG: hypothetical protein KatS3mg049_1105 [Caldilinea sp.]
MSSKIGQSERIAAEMQFAPSPEDIAGRAAWIVNRYRLQPLDLPEGRFVGQIHSVNTQGLDTLTPLVYIAGLSKPVALSEADVQTLVRFSGSPFARDWIGLTVAVGVVEETTPGGEHRQAVRLFVPGAEAAFLRRSSPAAHRRQPAGLIIGLAVLLALLAFSMLMMEQGGTLEALLEQVASWAGR